jgi:hypothetical protein
MYWRNWGIKTLLVAIADHIYIICLYSKFWLTYTKQFLRFMQWTYVCNILCNGLLSYILSEQNNKKSVLWICTMINVRTGDMKNCIFRSTPPSVLLLLFAWAQQRSEHRQTTVLGNYCSFISVLVTLHSITSNLYSSTHSRDISTSCRFTDMSRYFKKEVKLSL